jgi:hypothetical protein
MLLAMLSEREREREIFRVSGQARIEREGGI